MLAVYGPKIEVPMHLCCMTLSLSSLKTKASSSAPSTIRGSIWSYRLARTQGSPRNVSILFLFSFLVFPEMVGYHRRSIRFPDQPDLQVVQVDLHNVSAFYCD